MSDVVDLDVDGDGIGDGIVGGSIEVDNNRGSDCARSDDEASSKATSVVAPVAASVAASVAAPVAEKKPARRRTKKDKLLTEQTASPTSSTTSIDSSVRHTTKVSIVNKLTNNEPVAREDTMPSDIDESCVKSSKKKRAHAVAAAAPAPAAVESPPPPSKRRKTEKRPKSPSSDQEIPVPPPMPESAQPAPPAPKKSKKKDESAAASSAAAGDQHAAPASHAAAAAALAPPVSVPSRKLVLNKVKEGVLADFELVDPRRLHLDESTKKKKFAASPVLTLALRLLSDKSLLHNEGLLLSGNVFVKPSVLAGFSVHVYGADANTRAVYSGSLFDANHEGFSVFVHNLGPSRQMNAGEVVAYLELRSYDDKLKVLY